MKFLAIFFGLALTCSASPFRPHATFVALSMVETGGRPTVIGAAGERTAWQLMEVTWRKYTRAPFAQASTDRVLARMVAETHFQTLVAQLKRQGWPVTARAIARLWNPNAPAAYVDQVAQLVEVLP